MIPGIAVGRHHIPQVGLGLWQVKDTQLLEKTVQDALAAGYRHFDTAQIYGNESLLGDVLRRSQIPRKELFITTKISVQNFRKPTVMKSFDASLLNLQTDYVDLLLLHFPVTFLRKGAWTVLESIHSTGRARAIGVSNYTIKHLEQMKQYANMVPAVNQVELHVYLQQPDLLTYCRKQGIAVEAYSPLAHGNGLDNPVLSRVAKKHHKTPAQIMIRWCIEQGAIPLPKSTTSTRIVENINVFDFSLSKQDMTQLASLDKNMRTCWDPTKIP
jgi:diketogulonate reductase-like aldo/keto reductase